MADIVRSWSAAAGTMTATGLNAKRSDSSPRTRSHVLIARRDVPGAVTEDPAGRADLKHPLGRPGDKARFPEIARVRVPICDNEANGVQAAHGLKMLCEQHEHPSKIPRLPDQHVMNAARRVTPADFENHVALETFVAHQLRDLEARVGMPHVSPPERLLTHVTQDHVPLGKLSPERVERLINVIDELEPRLARVGQAQTDRDQ